VCKNAKVPIDVVSSMSSERFDEPRRGNNIPIVNVSNITYNANGSAMTDGYKMYPNKASNNRIENINCLYVFCFALFSGFLLQ
jgi:hypothetical protein